MAEAERAREGENERDAEEEEEEEEEEEAGRQSASYVLGKGDRQGGVTHYNIHYERYHGGWRASETRGLAPRARPCARQEARGGHAARPKTQASKTPCGTAAIRSLGPSAVHRALLHRADAPCRLSFRSARHSHSVTLLVSMVPD
jgi:hypothetical protein